MFKRFSRLRPYFRRNSRAMLLGAIALLAANYFDVQALVLLGEGIDVLGWRAGSFTGFATSSLGLILGVIVVVSLAGAIGRFWMRWYIIGVSREIEFGLRNDLFRDLQKLSPSFYAKYPTGDIMARMTNDLEAVRMLIGPAVMYMASTALMLPMSLYQMIKISWVLTLVAWSPMLLIAPLFFFFSSRIHARFVEVQKRFSEISTRVQEHLTGIRVVKAYVGEAGEQKRFEQLSQEYVRENIELAKLQAFFIPLMGFVVGLSLLALVAGGGAMIIRGAAGGRGITEGKLIAFFVLLMANIWPMAALGWVFSLWERGTASMSRIDELFDAKAEVTDSPETASRPHPEMHGRIEVRDLTFSYPGAGKPALKHLSVTVPAGRTLGLTGPVGCGKSTLAHLLARRFNPPRGTILVDGVDLLDWPLRTYRSRVGIVDQEPFVFSDTVRGNIAYGIADEHDPAVERVSRISQLEKDLPNLPSGIETLLGERGINLSGGQRQRAALARALASDPAILILDDALSAVDTHTEEDILRGLGEFMEGRTTLLISHRIRTVSICDHILYIEAGRVVEEGTHEQLLALEGHYWALAHRQQLAEEIEATA